MENISELKCPYCGKMLTSAEYDDALEEFRKTAAEEYSVRFEKYKRGFEDQMLEQEKKHRVEIEYLKKIHYDHARLIQQQLKAVQDKHIEDVRKGYNELTAQREKNFTEKIQQIFTSHKKELDERDKQLQLIQQHESKFKAEAIETAREAVKIEIIQKEQQISRFREKVESLEKQLTITQPELKGEAGEVDLLDTLKNAFQENGDIFTRQTRGESEGDILQQIKSPSGVILKTTIVYDNKEVASVAKKDIDKGKYYKDYHNTDYFIIVSRQLPKCIKNRYIGKKDGILLVHRDVIVGVARIIRAAIIEIAKLSASKESQETKESKLYEYIRSREFCRKVELLYENETKLVDLQTKERKDHEIIWNKRNDLHDQLRNACIEISGRIDAIIQQHLFAGA